MRAGVEGVELRTEVLEAPPHAAAKERAGVLPIALRLRRVGDEGAERGELLAHAGYVRAEGGRVGDVHQVEARLTPGRALPRW